MSKELNHNEVLESIQKKIELKKRLRVAKKKHDENEISHLTQKISKIENKLSSSTIEKI